MQRNLLLGILLIYIRANSICAQSSTFTYQGLLVDHSQRGNGIYDFRFRLADAPANGNYLGDILTRSNVVINDGVFTVTLDFGAALFDGSQRWLEIGVQTNTGQEHYTILHPLQPLTSACGWRIHIQAAIGSSNKPYCA